MLRKAFTLIELLVVIAIIAILAAILFPVFAQAKNAAKKTVSLSNVKQISLGLTMYATDSDDTIMPSAVAANSINNAPTAYVYESSMMLMQPYIKSYALWTAPADDHNTFADGGVDTYLYDGSLKGKKQRLSYNYVAPIVTVQNNNTLDPNTGIGSAYFIGSAFTRSTTSFDEPSNTISFAEVWSDGMLGQADGSTLANCDAWKLAGRVPSASPTGGNVLPSPCSGNSTNAPTKGYANGTANYAMTDGSAKSLNWGQVRQNDFYKFKVSKPTDVRTP